MVVPDYGRGYAFVFCVVNTSRRMFLAAELQKDRDAWVQALGKSLNQVVHVQSASYARKRLASKNCSDSIAQPSGPTSQKLPPHVLLPSGWEQKIDSTGRPYYIDHVNKRTQYEFPSACSKSSNPRHSVADINVARTDGIPSSVDANRQLKRKAPPPPDSQRPIIQRSQTADNVAAVAGPGQAVHATGYVDMKDNGGEDAGKMASLSGMLSATNLGPLPHGWEERVAPNGKAYYVNHDLRTTQYEDPRCLPAGWEQRYDPQGRPYYVDHINKTTTYEDPRKKRDEIQKRQTKHDGKSLSEITLKLKNFQLAAQNVEFTKNIGEGAFGEVWLGTVKGIHTNPTGKTLAAIKLMKSRTGSTKNDTDRETQDFLREAEVMSRFNHPHVISLLAVQTNQMPYLIISEYMNKGDLKKVLKNDRKSKRFWPEKLKLECALQAADGLKYLATVKSFVHRDVAARNVLVHGDDDGPDKLLCKITDFGLSRDIYESQYYRFNINEKRALLPVKWLAVESLEDQIYTHKTDVWGFGVLLWEIFAMGIMPYPGIDARVVWKELRNGLRLSRPENCPGQIYDLILACTSFSPDARPTFPMIYTRLREEIELCSVLQTAVYSNTIPKNSSNSKSSEPTGSNEQSVQTFVSKTVRLTRRSAVANIESMDDIVGLKRELVEDILHCNFVDFDSSASLEELADQLRMLWIRRQRPPKH
ncbi:ephrin type-A receptor 4-A-like [Corticium candelabrum]|uniref:ephrin type-A receptor 4-A-like n=1 Tax=Corticium candelabrum TaxID=121492 RepID=UPI002E258F9D|nr:ephrin type-A receptor 4-A-like [Corticium candelabrum]